MKRALPCLVLFAVLQPIFFPAFGQNGTTLPEGKTLAVGIVHDPPYLIKGKNGEWSGFNVDIWKTIAGELKVPYELKEMEFSRLLEALKENRIDLAIDGFFLLAEREEHIDFTVPLGSSRLALATLPNRMDHPWVAALKIFFSWGIIRILLLLLAALFVLGLIFWLMERKHNPEQFGGGATKGLGSGIYWVGSTLASGVCVGISLKSLAARILGLVWMLACAVTLSALTASLTTSLTESKNMTNTVAAETLRHMRLAGVEGSAEATVLERMEGTRYTLYGSEEDALKALLNGQVDGYLYDEITLHYYGDNEYRDKIMVYPTDLKRFSFAYGLPKGSPWRTRINVVLLNFMEKPDWAFLLNRYGMGRNFEEISQPTSFTKRRGAKN